MFKRKYLLLSIIIITLIFVSSCTKETKPNSVDETFTSEELNFNVEIPSEWSEKYGTESYENGVSFYSLSNMEYGGTLCSIERLVGELITKEDLDQAPVSEKIILQENGYTYILRMPSDVQSAIDNNKLKKEYDEMLQAVDSMADSIKTLDDSRPQAKIEGYKLIGSSFFIVEIPEGWNIKTNEDYQLRWEIYSGENIVGYIELLPYKSIYDVLYVEADLNKVLVDDEMEKRARIFLNDEDSSQEIMDNMISTFEFTYSPYTILDTETAAAKYIKGGGKMLFGQIEDIEIVGGEPKIITIKLKEFISDESLDNGFAVNDLGIKEEYILEGGVQIVPLAPPNYNSFEAYGTNILDKEFIQSYEYLYDFHYNFIIGSDGQLKIIMGFYLP